MLRTHRIFARGIAVLAVLVAVAVVSVRCGAHGVERFEGGTAHKTDADAHWVLTLKGTWREMGRQYGGLVGDELRQFLAEITEDVAGRGMPLDEQLENARSMAATFSLNLNELLKGMAESSGLSEDEVLVLNAGICMLSTVVLGGEPPSACSGLAVWDEYTPDGALVRAELGHRKREPATVHEVSFGGRVQPGFWECLCKCTSPRQRLP